MALPLRLNEEERFAEVVKTFPGVNDKTAKGYKEKDNAAIVWNSVGAELDFIADGKVYLFNLFDLCEVVVNC